MVGAIAFQEAQTSEWNSEQEGKLSQRATLCLSETQGGEEVKHCNIGRHSLAHFSISQTIYLLYWTCGYTRALSSQKTTQHSLLSPRSKRYTIMIHATLLPSGLMGLNSNFLNTWRVSSFSRAENLVNWVYTRLGSCQVVMSWLRSSKWMEMKQCCENGLFLVFPMAQAATAQFLPSSIVSV